MLVKFLKDNNLQECCAQEKMNFKKEKGSKMQIKYALTHKQTLMDDLTFFIQQKQIQESIKYNRRILSTSEDKLSDIRKEMGRRFN